MPARALGRLPSTLVALALAALPLPATAQDAAARRAALAARARAFELPTPYVPPPAEALVHHTADFAKRGKIESTVNNARRARDLVKDAGSLAAFFWSFEPAPADRPRRLTWPVLRRMATTPGSIALSRELKKRGWTFVGPTTAYAFMQAMGLVDDHVEGCAVRECAERARARFRRPLPSRAAAALPGRPLSAARQTSRSVFG